MNIFQDWNANRGNTKGRLVMLLFRIASYSSYNKGARILLMPYNVFYKFFVDWLLGIGLPSTTKVGRNCRLYHGQALVINGNVEIGENCILRHCTTIGNKQAANGLYTKGPVIGNNVDIGCNVCIIGEISVGNHVKIGSGSVVVKNIESYSTAVGNPAMVLKSTNREKPNENQ